jgi:YYY domain-containing protein
MIAAFYAAARAGEPPRFRLLAGLSPGGRRSLAALGGPVLLAALSLLLYQPYAYWYGQGYNAVDLWQGARTPLIDYFTHWGLFLFVIVAWMAAETIDWMAVTPVSALRRLEPYRQLIWGGLILLISLILALGLRLPGMEDLPFGKGIQVAWLALPLAAWAGILLLRPGIDDARRAALFLVGTGLALTLVVEVIVLRGDIGRMNTVFKFYLQVWTLFAVCAAAAGGWLLNDLPRWAPSLRSAWLAVLTMLVAAAALYPLTGAVSKVKDRIAETAPRTLDGMAYMQYATYHDQGGPMDLSQDYRAIRWMQANVSGSPVIVEGNTPEYRWGSRFTINTGLPGVVGWNWHQRQQRGTIVPADWVTDRIGEVAQFYLTSESEEARAFLRKYDAAYIVVGQLERAYYPGPGLEKFPALEGVLWRLAYQDLGTAIYEVIRE